MALGLASGAGAAGPLPPTLWRYILGTGRRHQAGLLVLSVAVFLLSAAPLEIQRRVVNGAIHGQALAPIVRLALAYLGLALLEGAIKLGLNMYRAWVSETAVLDLRARASALSAGDARHAAMAAATGTQASVVLSEVEPIGGFVGISVSEPLLQTGILCSVFGYLVYLQPVMALLCMAAVALQLGIVPPMQAAINRRAARRIETLRSVGGDIVDAAAGHADARIEQQGHIRRVFRLNLQIFGFKYGMNFLMNLTHHLSVALALGLGGYFVIRGSIEVGTVVAFVSGLGKVIDPWGDLVNWFREMTSVRMRYGLLTEALGRLVGPGHNLA